VKNEKNSVSKEINEKSQKTDVMSSKIKQRDITQNSNALKKRIEKPASIKSKKTEILSKPIKKSLNVPETKPELIKTSTASRHRTRTRTLSPSEIKMLPEQIKRNEASLDPDNRDEEQGSNDLTFKNESSEESETERSENMDYEDDFEVNDLKIVCLA